MGITNQRTEAPSYPSPRSHCPKSPTTPRNLMNSKSRRYHSIQTNLMKTKQVPKQA
jgi:hypothetical protein